MKNLPSYIESILFVAGRPVKISELVKVLDSDKDQIRAALDVLKNSLADRGISLLEKDDRMQLVTAPENNKAVSAFLVAEQREKLTEAAIETLAIILYKQPISRAEIEAIRGVNSQYILRQLLIRGLIEKTTAREDARRLVYKTTIDFMSYLGLKDMKELPDFDDLTKSIQLPETFQNESREKPEENESSPQENEENSVTKDL